MVEHIEGKSITFLVSTSGNDEIVNALKADGRIEKKDIIAQIPFNLMKATLDAESNKINFVQHTSFDLGNPPMLMKGKIAGAQVDVFPKLVTFISTKI